MTHARRLVLIATAALLSVAMAGCTEDEATPAPPPASSATAPSSADTESQAPTPSPEDLAAASAEDVVRRYYLVRDELRRDPTRPLSELRSVASSTELAAQRALFDRERGQGLTQIGETAVAVLEIEGVNLGGSSAGGGPGASVQVDVCWDVSAVDIVDDKGMSVVSPDRPDSGWIRYTVVGEDEATEDEWRVATSQDLERTPCAAA